MLRPSVCSPMASRTEMADCAVQGLHLTQVTFKRVVCMEEKVILYLLTEPSARHSLCSLGVGEREDTCLPELPLPARLS